MSVRSAIDLIVILGPIILAIIYIQPIIDWSLALLGWLVMGQSETFN